MAYENIQDNDRRETNNLKVGLHGNIGSEVK